MGFADPRGNFDTIPSRVWKKENDRYEDTNFA
jgi:hypothetical protein